MDLIQDDKGAGITGPDGISNDLPVASIIPVQVEAGRPLIQYVTCQRGLAHLPGAGKKHHLPYKIIDNILLKIATHKHVHILP